MSKASIWARLKAKGFSDYACAAIMGNMQQESAFRPNNVEDRYHLDTGRTDEQYTAAVDNGSYSRTDFMYDGGRAYGYGLCQWTFYSRKGGLYDLCKARSVSIADEQAQIDWLFEELHQPVYRTVIDTLTSGASLYDMTRVFMCVFENPADQSQAQINYRYSLAAAVYEEFAGSVPDPDPEPEPQPQPPEPDGATTPYWPPRMLCRGMKGADVGVLQWVLIANGHKIEDEFGVFDTTTNNSLIAYQGEHGLVADGIAGPMTYRSMGVSA